MHQQPLSLSLPIPIPSAAELAGRMKSNGGLSRSTEEDRWLATVIALGCFLSAGHSRDTGPFRQHLERLEKYLANSPLTAGDPLRERLVDRLLRGIVPAIAWQDYARRIRAGKRIRKAKFCRGLRAAI